MKTKTELEQDIINITMRIHKEYPELSKYIAEMPVKVAGIDPAGMSSNDLQGYYNSLEEVLAEYSKTHEIKQVKDTTKTSKLSGYPLYPPSEDIFNQGKVEMDFNPDDLSKNKAPNLAEGSLNEKDFQDDMSGDDLDVPGSELDDQLESVGSEDEENNYYSLGGDNHNDLEEDNG
ncbi:hypothetical protein [Haliscomenobacter sp.]|uniref:hypothetical protein n=1 Tax=Haliscomenobacter sp. TaxID=2717303 RepID=UPI0035944B5D